MNISPTTNETVATTRTGWFTMVALYFITLVNEFLPDDIDLPTWVAPVVVAAVIAFLYRLSLVLSNYKWFGVFLFLINRAPGYATPPPADPTPDQQPAPVDRGGVSVESVLVMVAISIIVTFTILLLADLI